MDSIATDYVNDNDEEPGQSQTVLAFSGYRLSVLSGSALGLIRSWLEADLSRAIASVRKHGWGNGRAEARDAIELLIGSIDMEFAERDRRAMVGRR